MREVKLPSGAVLVVNAAPFGVSKALYQAFLAELKEVHISTSMDVEDSLKNAFCSAFSSSRIDSALAECMKRCTINSLKIDDQTFEPVEMRDDYMTVCIEIAKENVFPFSKSLYAEFRHAMAMLASTQK